MNEIISIISTCGFPIAACCMMFYPNANFQKTLSEISATMTLLTERIKDIETKISNKEG